MFSFSKRTYTVRNKPDGFGTNFLIAGLEKLGFIQSQYDPCVLWRRDTIIVIYVDDTIITGPNPKTIRQAIVDLRTEFEITSSDEVKDFLGVQITRDIDRQLIHLTQPHLIQAILNDLGLFDQSKPLSTPAYSTRILQRHESSKPHDAPWKYRSVVGKLNFLEKSTRPDLAYSVHQCARFCHDPKVEHSKAIKTIGRYLLGSKAKGLSFKPRDEGLRCYCDADFSGLWNPETADSDSNTARSRTGYVVTYAGCPIIWASKLQTEIALSVTEAEYVSLSQSLRDVLPLMGLLREIHAAGFPLCTTAPLIRCQVFEDNMGAIEMVKVPKMRPRTKHINIKYHHFRHAVAKGEVTVQHVASEDQLADILTKPLSVDPFTKLRFLIMGW